ncbi:hypothetical protein ACIRL0_36455 [Streptomyces sp. NPDC102365]|uniref:hypothetical protein n=1 Tax=Streptomyces sp. NPDC102365 TaxID=3366162 RepID=UPI00381F118D
MSSLAWKSCRVFADAQLARRPSAPARSRREMYQPPRPGFCSVRLSYSLTWNGRFVVVGQAARWIRW